MKRLPFLTPAQRRALLVLEWVLLLGIIGLSVWSWQRPSGSHVKGEKQSGTQNSSNSFALELPQEEPFETFPFDPNTADSTTLLRLGLSPWQVRSIYRYRAKHGRYHTPDDFKRLPGMTNEQWERLRPCVRIAKEFQYVTPTPKSFPKEEGKRTIGEIRKEEINRENTGARERDTVRKATHTEGRYPGGPKLLPGQTVDISTADTAQLKMIPGIASKRAARIVAYRTKLGGFVSIEQAMEATEMPDSVLKYMTVSSLPVQKINVNKLSVQQLMKHPYLNFYKAKAINEYRLNHGDLHSIEELSRLEGFRPTDIERLQPYIEF